MQTNLPLNTMSTEEKLQVINDLWESIAHAPGEVSSPPWHGEVRVERAKRIEKGCAKFTDWDTAKQEVTDRLQ